MLRFVNHKFDLFFFEHSRRILCNGNTSLSHGCHANYGTTCLNPATISRYEAASLMSNQIYKDEIKWQIFQDKNIETGLCRTSQHHKIILRDEYIGYILLLKQLLEALNNISSTDLNERKNQHHLDKVCKFMTEDQDGEKLGEIYNPSADDITERTHDRGDYREELLYFRDKTCHLFQNHSEGNLQFVSSLINENAFRFLLSAHHFPSSPDTLTVVSENFFPQVMCSSPEGPKDSDDKKKENIEGPSREQLLAIQEHLIENFPKFLSEKHDYSIYAKDVQFVINWYPDKSYSTVGTMNYAIEVAKLRLFVHIRLVSIRMTLLKVTNHNEDGCIEVRWRITGLPHSKAFWRYFYDNNSDVGKDNEWLDGFSTFHLNSDGLIKKHIIDRVIPETEKKVKEKPSMIEKLGLNLQFPVTT